MKETYYLFASKVQATKFDRATAYKIVVYDKASRQRIGQLPMIRREGEVVVTRLQGEEYRFTTGGWWPEVNKPIKLRLL